MVMSISCIVKAHRANFTDGLAVFRIDRQATWSVYTTQGWPSDRGGSIAQPTLVPGFPVQRCRSFFRACQLSEKRKQQDEKFHRPASEITAPNPTVLASVSRIKERSDPNRE